jgi:hypothetical protein
MPASITTDIVSVMRTGAELDASTTLVLAMDTVSHSELCSHVRDRPAATVCSVTTTPTATRMGSVSAQITGTVMTAHFTLVSVSHAVMAATDQRMLTVRCV